MEPGAEFFRVGLTDFATLTLDGLCPSGDASRGESDHPRESNNFPDSHRAVLYGNDD